MISPASPESLRLSGDLRIYSAPRALIRHIQWSLNQIFGQPIELEWRTQRLAAGTLSTEYQWRGESHLASTMASTLKSWHYLRFEVREYSTFGGEGVLYRCTPELGLHQAVTSSTGDVMIHENRIMTALNGQKDFDALQDSLHVILGTAWDEELEWYRRGTLDSDLDRKASI